MVSAAVSNYTPDRVEKILRALKSGNARSVAARYGGVTKKVLEKWIEDFPEFLVQVEEAEAAFEIRNVAIIQNAAEKRWVAAAWLLERTHPERWGKVDRVEIYQVQRQAEALVEELRSEGIEITAMEIMRDREALAKRSQNALPTPVEQSA